MHTAPRNAVTLAAEIADTSPLRHTPAGLPLVALTLTHHSTQTEAGIERQASFDIAAVAVGEMAAAVSKFRTGDAVAVEGFLAARRRSGVQIGTQLILHITNIQHT